MDGAQPQAKPLAEPTWLADGRLRWALFMALVIFAASRAFLLDDAFISLRYAENFAQGEGLVFNPGEAVEGYTNFLWTLLLSLPFWLGLDPLLFTHILSLTLLAGTLALTYQLAERILGSARLSLLAVATLGLLNGASAFGTSGLETQLLTFLTVASLGLALRESLAPRHAFLLSLTSAAAVMTRPDAAIMALAWGLIALWRARRTERFAQILALLILPAALLGALWAFFKLSFYGDLLPNTYYAKLGGTSDLMWGLEYLWAFSLATLLLPMALLSPLWRKPPDRARTPQASNLRALWFVLLLHTIVVALVGGDFMHFRFMVPLMPVMVILILQSLANQVGRAVLVGASLVLWGYLSPAALTEAAGIEDISTLEGHLHTPHQDWVGVGKHLRYDLPDRSDVRIATTAAGAIPYYSKLPTLDMLGLTDAEVAHHGDLFEAQRNHTRIAPFRLLKEQGVNLMLGQPWLRRPSPKRRYRFGHLRNFNVFKTLKSIRLPPRTRIVEIPLGPRRVLVALYLTPHPHIESLIESRRWRAYDLTAGRHKSPSAGSFGSRRP